MNILIIGSGGREHTFAWKIRQSTQCKKLYVCPGNAGTAQVAENIPLAVDDFEGIADLVLKEAIQLVVVGPEVPLVQGIRDFFEAREELKEVGIVGPGKAGALLEGSKDFSKNFMEKHAIPTASSQTFTKTTIDEGIAYLEKASMPIVMKADGLAAGKGVIIAHSLQEAQDTLRSMLLDEQFGEASSKVLIESFLDGIELSVFVLTDGDDYVVLPEAKDYKRIGEGDTGPNTGGMGAISPVPFADEAFMDKVEQKVIRPTIAGLKMEGIPYQGFIFIGLMNMNGEPYVIEYNVRMGDPETQAVIPRLENDLVDLLWASAKGGLSTKTLRVNTATATTVVLVAEGYPGPYQKDKAITGLDSDSDCIVFHAGTKLRDTEFRTNGGRVVAITGIASDITKALDIAYHKANSIRWEGMYFRKDIGQDLVKLQ